MAESKIALGVMLPGFLGEYKADRSYGYYDVVMYGADSYIAKQPSLGQLPDNGAYWMKLTDVSSAIGAVDAAADEIIGRLIALETQLRQDKQAGAFNGPQGEKGDKGEPGADGQSGAPGLDGIDGKSAFELAVGDGFTGSLSDWLIALKGLDGRDGADGRDGRDGADGKDGTGVTILGSYDSPEELAADHPEGAPGDAYMIGSFLYVWSTADGGWESVGEIKGPKGEAGYTPVKGVDYFDGADGTPGRDGQDGKDGRDGLTTSVAGVQQIDGDVPLTAAHLGALTEETDPTVPTWAKAPSPPAETDPTVPAWAKQPEKPVYTVAEVSGLQGQLDGKAPTVHVHNQYLTEESDPTVPAWAKAPSPPAETDPTVPAWAKAAQKPAYTAAEVGAVATTQIIITDVEPEEGSPLPAGTLVFVV